MTQRATLCGRIMLVPPLLRFCPYRPQSFLTRIDAIVGCRDAPHRCRAVNAAVQTLLRRLNTAAEHFLANRSYVDGRPFTTPAVDGSLAPPLRCPPDRVLRRVVAG